MKQVIIIGAGPAGLTAGYEILKNDGNKEYNVTILEETEYIGGISKTVNYKGNRLDIGGHRFFSKDERVINFWNRLMPIQTEDSEVEDNVMLVRKRVSRIYYDKKFFEYPISMKLSTFKAMGFVKTIKVGVSYICSCIHKQKEKSLQDFYINRFGKVLYSMFFEKYTEKLWGRHPKDISADWGAQRVKGISIKAVIKDMINKIFGNKNKENTETSLIEEFWYPKYGPGQLWELLAKRNEELGAKIKKGYKVSKINFQKGKIVSVECKINGKTETINGDIFISSMPMNDLISSFNGIKVPNQINHIAKGLPFRDFITVGVLVKKINLKNKTKIKTLGNIVPDCWIYIQEPDVKMLRLQIFNNWSPYLVADSENTVWIGTEYTCLEGDKYWNMSEKEFSDFAIEELVKMNIIDKKDVIDYHREKVKKAYPAYFDTYNDIDKLISFVNKIDNLYCIGRNGQHRYNNMDHSMLTAMEAVKNIKENIKDKSNIWSVNTEKEYLETKK